MWYQIFIPAPVLMIPILVMTTKGNHSPKNDSKLPSDVIVTYSNHAEANDDRVLHIPETTASTAAITTDVLFHEYKSVTTEKSRKRVKRPKKKSSEAEEPQDDVLFIPNERDNDRERNEHYLQNERASLSDLIGGHKAVEDLLASKNVRLETESPVSDIIFVIGKNNENIDQTDKNVDKTKWQGNNYNVDITTRAPRLNCNNLHCNNVIKSVCGEKTDDNYQHRYRLFLNDCYFRKVNCNFKNPINRFKKVLLENCKNIGAHTQTPFTFSFKPATKVDTSLVQLNNTRRSTSSRRSMTMNVHGQFCSHPCPVSCPEHYEPECAVSSTGRRRVFVNHCALDHNSCSFGIVWHSVPLAECVGGKKADMRQNAGFIGWMQRVGIVDNRGRLVYETQ